MNRIDNLLEKSCYIMGFLPEQVNEKTGGQFFDVENFLINSDRYTVFMEKFESIILKLMCYYHTSIYWNTWVDYPQPEKVAEITSEMSEHHSGILNVLFPQENTLLVFEWGDLNLSVYNPSEQVQAIMKKLASSEGLFWRKSEVNNF